MKPLVGTEHAMELFAGEPENTAAALVSAFPQLLSCLRIGTQLFPSKKPHIFLSLLSAVGSSSTGSPVPAEVQGRAVPGWPQPQQLGAPLRDSPSAATLPAPLQK